MGLAFGASFFPPAAAPLPCPVDFEHLAESDLADISEATAAKTLLDTSAEKVILQIEKGQAIELESREGRGVRMSEQHPDFQEDLESSIEEDVDEPPMFKVLLHNDDYTTMEFVVEVLQTVFHKNSMEATRIMLLVHRNGTGVCGVFTAEVAETKVELVHHLARKNGFPLQCSMEEV